MAFNSLSPKDWIEKVKLFILPEGLNFEDDPDELIRWINLSRQHIFRKLKKIDKSLFINVSSFTPTAQIHSLAGGTLRFDTAEDLRIENADGGETDPLIPLPARPRKSTSGTTPTGYWLEKFVDVVFDTKTTGTEKMNLYYIQYPVELSIATQALYTTVVSEPLDYSDAACTYAALWWRKLHRLDTGEVSAFHSDAMTTLLQAIYPRNRSFGTRPRSIYKDAGIKIT